MRTRGALLVATVLLVGSAFAEQKDMKGQQAPPLAGATWAGMPVSLDAVKGNAVMLVFWNGDAPC